MLFLYAVTLPWALTVSYPLAAIFKLCGLAENYVIYNYCVEATWTPRATRLWKYSTTFGRFIVHQPNGSWRVKKHERVHVRQLEDQSVVALLLAVSCFVATGALWMSLGLWWSSLLWMLPNMLTACLRHGFSMDVAYRDAEHERSAYAQTDPPGNLTWCERRDNSRT